MPRIGAYYAIHYGADYLEHSIRSIYDYADLIGIFYTALPSHGHRDPTLRNPDSREALQAALVRAHDPQAKVHWYDGNWFSESQHRNHAIQVMQSLGAEIVLMVDSDEIWDGQALEEALAWATTEIDASRLCVNFVHFWRSFGWVCRDEMMPARLIMRNEMGRDKFIRLSTPVLHFGYAQRPEMVRYKATIHGHRGEWRSGWFDGKFLAWSPYPADGARVGDVHPTCGGIWYPDRFDREKLPGFMRSHAYWDMELIE